MTVVNWTMKDATPAKTMTVEMAIVGMIWLSVWQKNTFQKSQTSSRFETQYIKTVQMLQQFDNAATIF